LADIAYICPEENLIKIENTERDEKPNRPALPYKLFCLVVFCSEKRES
jgi:hypothetical protein